MTQKPEPENLQPYITLMQILPDVAIKGATMPYTSMNGNMYSFLKEGSVALRLPAEEREAFIREFNSMLFETLGTVMKEYVTVSPEMLKKPSDLKAYVVKSHAYAKTLKAKAD